MGSGASNTREGTISGAAFMSEDDHSFLIQQVKQLADIWEGLESLNVHHTTEHSLSDLLFQIEEVIKAIQALPPSVIERGMISKKAFCQDLTSALIELLLARGELSAKGRTFNFYKHLLMCQMYLSYSLGIEIEHKFQRESSQQAFFVHRQENCTDFLIAQRMLEQANVVVQSSMLEEECSIGQFDHVNEALSVLYTIVQDLSMHAHNPLYFEEETFNREYQFCINISYLDEQIPRLLERIKTFHSAYYSSPKRVKKIRREVAYNLEVIVYSCQQVSPTFTVLLKSLPVKKRKSDHLRLIYSSENR